MTALILAALLALPSTPRIHEPVLSGVASWYPAGSTDAAAGPALRRMLGRGWRGTTVRVCAPQRGCVTVRLTDWCGCPGNRVIDLPIDAFRRLAPLSRGLLRVTVTP